MSSQSKYFRTSKIAAILSIVFICSAPASHAADDFYVYSMYRALDLGDNPGAVVQKDYYVNMGSAQGLKSGAVLDVFRKVASYDLSNQKLYKDLTLPVAKIRVIHAEPNAAIARVVQISPEDRTPALTPRAIMVGDLVRRSD